MYRYLRDVKDYGANALSYVRDKSSAQASGRLEGARKRDFVITWMMQYASVVSEKLPDIDKIYIPAMNWKDLHDMFVVDLQAAGVSESLQSKITHFRETFNKAPELKDYDMTRHKRNFSKCAAIYVGGRVGMCVSAVACTCAHIRTRILQVCRVCGTDRGGPSGVQGA